METNYIAECAITADVNARQVEKVLTLLLKEDCTVPFIARYRKEMTGNLDETQIRSIQETYESIDTRENRRKYILDALEKQEVLTPDLKKAVIKAKDITQLEDIYAPFKSKRKTKAMKAIEKGLEPLALEIFEGTKDLEQLKSEFQALEDVKTFDEALEGAQAIIIERMVYIDGLKDALRDYYLKNGVISSSKRKDAEKIKDYLKFKDYFEFSETIKSLNDPKSSHRFLAMRRGMLLKILKVGVETNIDEITNLIEKYTLTGKNNACLKKLKFCSSVAYKVYLHSSLELEILTNLRAVAETASIEVFGANLKHLLLAPYLGGKIVMAIDPGIRTGCKVVVVDSTGKLLVDGVIYPHEPKREVQKSKVILEQLLKELKVESIAIGSGTFGRETLAFLESNVSFVKEGKIPATLVSEAGASVYSASKVAIEEFPDKDVTVRGAVSIGRRFQDPLSELVKIDPKSIGVGQYQHDVNQIKLKKSLEGVVEDCVNYVGVDLNSASKHILAYISGIGPTVAKNIVSHRDMNGRFKNRMELLKVSRFSEKIFEQSAGFLRIYDGDNPLDKTFVHPEQFNEINEWCESNKIKLDKLLSDDNTINKLKSDSTLKAKIGPLTFKDICDSLSAPTQDPRTEFKSTEFDKTIKSINDVVIGQWYTGVVNNITNFGAFVDIGIKESGLVHVSQIANKFVSDPMEVVKVGQEVKVRVLEIDKERKRLALSCKKDDGEFVPKAKNNSIPKQQNISNNAFAKLSGFKVR